VNHARKKQRYFWPSGKTGTDHLHGNSYLAN
jgi:hypothetical protein